MARDIAFREHPTDDPHKHIRSFIKICETIKMNGVSSDTIKTKIVSFFFTGSCEGLVGDHPL